MIKHKLTAFILAEALILGSSHASAAQVNAYDINGDGSLTVADALLLTRFITEDSGLSLPESFAPDVNGDGVATAADVQILLKALTAEEKKNDALAYYDLLAEEWEKGGVTGYTSSTPTITQTDILIGSTFQHFSPIDTLFSYYMANSMGVGKFIVTDINSALVCNGFLYTLNKDKTNAKNAMIYKMNMNSQIIASYALNNQPYCHFTACTPNGHLIYSLSQDSSGTKHYYILSPDFNTVKEISNPRIPAPHDLTEEVQLTDDDFSPAVYKNRIYLKRHHLYLDCDTLEWHSYDAPDNFWFHTCDRCIGRYTLGYISPQSCIFDMETNTVVTQFLYASAAFDSYYGGKHSLHYSGDKMSFVQYPSDNSTMIVEKTYDNIKGGINTVYPINDEYYAFIDKYGIFIHTYEKGDSEEVTALLF